MVARVHADARYARQAAVVARAGTRVVSVLFGVGWSVGIKLVGRREMTKMNRYRDKAGPTDVLAFDGEEPGYVGDVALCVPVARQQAQSLGHALDVELKVLTVHALVHLAGLDHERSHHEAVLQAEVEAGLLSVLGVPVEAALARRGMA